MGFFSKIFKGVKKVFKKIGKGIKKVAMKVGKFMDKIGIVGQIALMFIPLGPILGGLLKGVEMLVGESEGDGEKDWYTQYHRCHCLSLPDERRVE